MLLDSIGDATCHIADEMKFDVQIMILGFLINLFVNSLQKKSVVSLVNYKNKKLNMSLLDAILKVWLYIKTDIFLYINSQLRYLLPNFRSIWLKRRLFNSPKTTIKMSWRKSMSKSNLKTSKISMLLL